MPNNPVNWFEIYVNDMPRAKNFDDNRARVRLENSRGPRTSSCEPFRWSGGRGAGGALAKMAGAPVGGGGTRSTSDPTTAPRRPPG